ncbi:MAG: hypothetical protein ABIR57_07850 [Aeromicrobium sp.]
MLSIAGLTISSGGQTAAFGDLLSDRADAPDLVSANGTTDIGGPAGVQRFTADGVRARCGTDGERSYDE